MKRLLDFWNRHSTFIITVLAFLFFMDLCSRLIMPRPETEKSTSHDNREWLKQETPKQENGLKSYEEIMMEREARQDPQQPLLVWLMGLLLAGATVWYLVRKGLLPKVFPGRVTFRTTFIRDKKNNRLLLEIKLVNTTRESQTFLTPQLLFKKVSEAKRFKLKSNDFPLTLTSGTRHTMIIDLEQFWEKVPALKSFYRVSAEIETTTGKLYKTRTLPKWWVFKHI